MSATRTSSLSLSWKGSAYWVLVRRRRPSRLVRARARTRPHNDALPSPCAQPRPAHGRRGSAGPDRQHIVSSKTLADCPEPAPLRSSYGRKLVGQRAAGATRRLVRRARQGTAASARLGLCLHVASSSPSARFEMVREGLCRAIDAGKRRRDAQLRLGRGCARGQARPARPPSTLTPRLPSHLLLYDASLRYSRPRTSSQLAHPSHASRPPRPLIARAPTPDPRCSRPA